MERKLIGVPVRPSRSICQPFQTAGVIAADDLVTGLISGLQVVGLPRELPRIETDKFKDYVQKYGYDRVTNYTSVAL